MHMFFLAVLQAYIVSDVKFTSCDIKIMFEAGTQLQFKANL